MWTRLVSLGLLAVLATAISCGGRANRRAGTGTADLQSLRHDGRERTYVVRVPATAIQRDTPVSLVIVLHGGGGNARNAETMTGFTGKATAEGFIVAYPNGTGRRRDALLTWNARHCCGYAMERRVDDVGFIDTLIGDLLRRYPIDPRRVYVTGMSNGAMMTHRVGITLSARVAAIAPVVGAVFGDEPRPAGQVSAIMINGMLDDMVPYRGGGSGGRFAQAWDGTPTRAAEEQARFWAGANGCSVRADSVDHGGYLVIRHACPGTLGVALFAVKDNGHAWPGGQKGSRAGDTPSAALDATHIIWEFFESHPRP